MKCFIILIFLSSFVFSKECYFNKVNEICFYKYFEKTNIYKFKYDEEYYTTKNNQIYTFDKIIEVKFNSIGAIFAIINDFELKFVDKIRKEVYLFEVNDRRELFPLISKLNRLDSVMKAKPHMTKRYTKMAIRAKAQAKKERLAKALAKSKNK